MNDSIDPALVAVLTQLWRAKQETPGRAWSLAKLSKQSDLPMSTLRRQLAGFVGCRAGGGADRRGGGVGSAWLTSEGVTLCSALFGEAL